MEIDKPKEDVIGDGIAGVSIIIPTFNAGCEFEQLLKCLKNQKLVNHIEIIIVDSGSTDGTIKKAKNHKVNIIEISISQFTHSFSRNLGAEKAKYDYIVFMTQDAIPEDSLWLFNLLQPLLEKDSIVASTCIEKPKENAGLFSRMAIAQQVEWLGVIDRNKIMQLPKDISTKETYEVIIRKNACLNDVACAYKKNIFLKYKYRLSYAEDLDMGKRLIEDGYQLSLLGKTKVIHSHCRSGLYYLKRMIVERIAYLEIFDEFEKIIVSESELISGIVCLYHNLLNWIKEINKISLMESKFSILLDIQKTCKSYSSYAVHYDESLVGYYKEMDLDEFILAIYQIYISLPEQNKESRPSAMQSFYDLYKNRFEGLVGYLWNSGDGIITADDIQEICKAMFCIYGNVVGTIWGDSIPDIGELKYLKQIHEILCKGI